MVTTVSIRLALRNIAERAYGRRPPLFAVVARVHASERVYSASIPLEFRDKLVEFLREPLRLLWHGEGTILVLDERQAQALVELALKLDQSEPEFF